MRILSVVRIKAYSRYWYDYLKEITLRRVDHQEYTIAEKDFKNLYLSDFEDLNLLLLHGHLNHLLGSDKRMLSTTVNLWTRLARTSRVTLKCSQSENGNPAEPTSNKRMVGDSDVHTLEDPTLILEILSRIFFLRLNLPDHKLVLTGSGDGRWRKPRTSASFHNPCSYSTIHQMPSMKVQAMFQSFRNSDIKVLSKTAKRPQVDDQRLDLADDLKEAQDHISHSITSHMTKITTSKYKMLPEESNDYS
ncbi:hypothetical protein Tco_0481671 [Tanacetum coccineum]